MSITTIDQAIAGMLYPSDFAKVVGGTMVAGRDHSFWYIGGLPGAGVTPTASGNNGIVLSGKTANGQLYWTNPVSGNTYLARFQGQATISGTLILCDRLWHAHIPAFQLTGTTKTYYVSGPIPPRDNDGNNDGEGVYAAFEVVTALGNGTPTLTIDYVSSAGVSGRTATNIMATANTPTAGDFFKFGLQAGDVGIQSIYGLTLSSTYTSGTANLVLYRPIARLELAGALVPNAIDALTGGFPRIYNDSNLFLVFQPSTTTTSNITGQVVLTQG